MRKLVITTVAAAAVLTAIPASSALAASPTRTIKGVLTNTADLNGRAEPSFAFTEVLNSPSGPKLGLDLVQCLANVHTHMAACDITLALRGGELLGHATIPLTNGPSDVHGTITSGTRDFSGAHGTLRVTGGGHGTNNLTVTYMG